MIKNYFKNLTKMLLGFVILVCVSLLTVYNENTVAGIVKLTVWIISGAKWLYYIKRNDCKKYFRVSFVSLGVYWCVIFVNILLESEVNSVLFIFLTAAIWVIALVRAFRAGNYFLSVINRYDPLVMREYNTSRDYKKRTKKLENELQKIKENAPEEVVEAIKRRELFPVIPYFHIEMIFLTILALWPEMFS